MLQIVSRCNAPHNEARIILRRRTRHTVQHDRQQRKSEQSDRTIVKYAHAQRPCEHRAIMAAQGPEGVAAVIAGCDVMDSLGFESAPSVEAEAAVLTSRTATLTMAGSSRNLK
jgi:hypothetical protein